MEKDDSISRKIMVGLGYFKLVDIFGVKIELMHKKETKLRTRFGGLTTTLFLFSLMVFFGLCVKTMLKREGDKISMGNIFY